MSLFKDAENTMAYAKIGLLGFAGSGKTRTATEIAVGLHKAIQSKKPVGFLDTETGSDFMIPIFRQHGIKLMVSKTRAFKDLAAALKESAKLFDILIIDSVTHYWVDIVESYKAKKNTNRLAFQDWGIIKPLWANDFSTPFVTAPLHIIVCGRAGFEYDYFEGDDGKMELYKTGTKMKAEGEFGFEPSLLIEMNRIKNPKSMEAYKEAKTKDQKLKAAKKIQDERQYVREAVVLKDRADVLDGKVFYNPTYADFAPHWSFLNIGGEHKPLEAGDSTGLFDKEGRPEWKIEQQQKDITLEEIEAALIKQFPASTGKDKTAKITILSKVFRTPSWTAIKSLSNVELKNGLRLIKDYIGVPENVETLLQGKDDLILPPPEPGQMDDVPMFGEAANG